MASPIWTWSNRRARSSSRNACTRDQLPELAFRYLETISPKRTGNVACVASLCRARVLSVYRAPTTRSRWPALACTARLSYPTAHPPRVLPVSSPHVQSHGKYARAHVMCARMMFWWVAVRGRLPGRHVERMVRVWGNGVSGTAKCVDECDLYKRLTLQHSEKIHSRDSCR